MLAQTPSVSDTPAHMQKDCWPRAKAGWAATSANVARKKIKEDQLFRLNRVVLILSNDLIYLRFLATGSLVNAVKLGPPQGRPTIKLNLLLLVRKTVSMM